MIELELKALLAVIVHAGKPDKMPGNFARGIIAAIFP
jgi:hypothetical protein